ncbi:MAG: sulfatase-like hydrolase/transferase [Candidatus Omnitrophica bacterium]|nr:sulfatase-like hydrolase/transferase [Candidatus Omnitrophota bacterium]MCM8810085.1 sulfatase-like hydrolase/transferase [Candidatus Omnitrophota bacterium]
MNIILIISDTLRRDFLGCYGNNWISTPNIDKFAKNSILFENAYIGSFPTVPNRHEILTGKFVFTYYKWAPLYQEVVRIPLLIYLPKIKHKKIKSFVQPPDITKTIYQLTSSEIPEDIHGESIISIIEGKKNKIRDFVISSPPIIYGSPAGEKITITDQSGWCYIYETEKGERYDIKAVDSIERETLKERIKGDELYFLPDDPKQEKNLVKERPDICKKQKEKIIEFLYQVKTDEKIINLWK